IAYLLRLSKGRALVPRISIRSIELRVIEDVENLRPELHVNLFAHRSRFEYADIPVVDRRIAAQCPRHIPDLSNRDGRGVRRAIEGVAVLEHVRIKHEAVFSRIVCAERSRKVRLAGTFETQRAALQLRVIAVVDQDRETALIRIDSRDLPSIQDFTR